MPLKTLRATLSLAMALVVTSCHAQSAPRPITPELQHRIESMIRMKVDLPPGTSIDLGDLTPGPLPGFDKMNIKYHTLDGAKGTITLLLSKDGKTLAQFNSYDISADPKAAFPANDRPVRGGGKADAPVMIVGYDDLECPFCAKMNATLFPALQQRYKDQVRVVYRSFPIEQHPWAMRAAVDTDCLAAQNGDAYWEAVDIIHSKAADYGGTERSLAKAMEEIDTETRRIGTLHKVDSARLDACIQKQDTTQELTSLHAGEEIGVRSTPTLFINGLKVEGAVPLSYFFGLVDDALRAAGQTPPPPYVDPTPATPATTAAPTSSTQSTTKPAGR